MCSNPKLRIYGPNEAECSKPRMSQKKTEMMSLVYQSVRAHLPPLPHLPLHAPRPLTKIYQKRRTCQARFWKTLLMPTLVITWNSKKNKNNLRYPSMKIAKINWGTFVTVVFQHPKEIDFSIPHGYPNMMV